MSDAPPRLLEDRVAIVTGARSWPAADPAATQGAGDTLGRIALFGDRATAFPLDVSKTEGRTEFLKAVVDWAGRIDVLVNNAGTSNYRSTIDMTFEDALSQMLTYFLGPWDLCCKVIPNMRAVGRGWILNIGYSTGSGRYNQLERRYGDLAAELVDWISLPAFSPRHARS